MIKIRHAALLLGVSTLIFGGAVEADAQARGQSSDPNVAHDPGLFAGLEYRMIGPSRGGRVTAVTGIAEQPGTFYMGATGGGVWKTTDYGVTWVNVSDGYFSTASIGAIDVTDSDPNIVYVGTGSDGLRSNVIAGRGVYKSTDAGKSWAFLGLRDVGQIGAVAIDPQNPDRVFVAAIGHAFGRGPARGVYRTTDGGTTWKRVLFISDSTGVADVEFAPDDPNEIYAAAWRAERKPWTIISGAREGGIFKSSDGGDNWTRLMNGLPSGLVGKGDLAVSAADPNRLYVLMEAPPPAGGLYRSDDRGASFRLVSTQSDLLDRPFYYTNVDADPTNADVVYVNSTRFWKSTDGGESFRRMSTPHGDNHDMWINPNDSRIFIQSNDGGANVTLNGGRSWSTQQNQPTAELYQVNVDDQFPYWVYAGQQDNSTIAVPSRPPVAWRPDHPAAHWKEIGGCETGPAVPKPGDPSVVYSNCKGRFGRYSDRTGQEQNYYVGAQNMYGHNPRDLKFRFQRVSPIEISPHDPNVIYHASQYLHKTTDEGRTWETISSDLTAFDPKTQVISGVPITRDITGEEFYSTIYVVEESPHTPGVIWVGANDGPVHITRDGGTSWKNITPKDLPPGGRVQTIDPSPHRPGKAYIAVYRYLLGDWQPYIYRTNDFGASWTRLTSGRNGIPADYPTRVVREDPDREGLLYAGSEFGMFISFDDGARWQPFQQNLPVVPVTDIKVHERDLVLSTMGRSFWILDDLTPLHQLNERVATAPAHLFQPRPAHRLRYAAFGRSPSGPEYVSPGAIVYYHLADAGEARLEILDASGVVIREFSGETAEGGEADDEPSMAGPPGVPGGAVSLSSAPGTHRFIWDLRHPGPWHAEPARSGRGGPLAAPGAYQVRLTVGDWSETRGLAVLIDPRVAADGVTSEDLELQLGLNLEIRDAISEARQAAHRIAEVRGALKERLAAGGGADIAERSRRLDRQLDALEDRLVTAEDRYPQPMLIDQLQYLYGMTNGADQRPGADAYTRLDELSAELAQCMAELTPLLGKELTELNRMLRARGLEPVAVAGR